MESGRLVIVVGHQGERVVNEIPMLFVRRPAARPKGELSPGEVAAEQRAHCRKLRVQRGLAAEAPDALLPALERPQGELELIEGHEVGPAHVGHSGRAVGALQPAGVGDLNQNRPGVSQWAHHISFPWNSTGAARGTGGFEPAC